MHSASALREINTNLVPQRRKRTGTRFPNICQDAYALGVSRIHLWFVLTGIRPGADLISSYTHLLTQQGRHVPSNLGKAA